MCPISILILLTFQIPVMLKVLPSSPVFNYCSQFTQSAELHMGATIKIPGNAKHMKRFPVLPSSQSVEGKILKEEEVHSASEDLSQTLFFRPNSSTLGCYNPQSKEEVAQNLLNPESEYLHTQRTQFYWPNTAKVHASLNRKQL